MIDALDTVNRKFIQFSLWKNCNNNCLFCCHKGVKRISNMQKIENLQYVISLLQSNLIDNFNEVGFIGGEFFNDELDDSNVEKLFFEIFSIMKSKTHIQKIYIATSLMFDIDMHLSKFISFVKSIGIDKLILFCTSFDTKYRFKDAKSLLQWEKNVEIVQKCFGRIHIETILMRDFIRKILDGKLSVDGIKKKYNADIDFIEPSFIEFYKDKQYTMQIIPDFFPSRKEFIDFVKDQCIKKKTIDIDRLLAIQLRPDALVQRLANQQWIIEKDRWKRNIRRTNLNGIPMKPGSYSDSDAEMYDDLQKIKQIIGGNI